MLLIKEASKFADCSCSPSSLVLSLVSTKARSPSARQRFRFFSRAIHSRAQPGCQDGACAPSPPGGSRAELQVRVGQVAACARIEAELRYDKRSWMVLGPSCVLLLLHSVPGVFSTWSLQRKVAPVEIE